MRSLWLDHQASGDSGLLQHYVRNGSLLVGENRRPSVISSSEWQRYCVSEGSALPISYIPTKDVVKVARSRLSQVVVRREREFPNWQWDFSPADYGGLGSRADASMLGQCLTRYFRFLTYVHTGSPLERFLKLTKAA